MKGFWSRERGKRSGTALGWTAFDGLRMLEELQSGCFRFKGADWCLKRGALLGGDFSKAKVPAPGREEHVRQRCGVG